MKKGFGIKVISGTILAIFVCLYFFVGTCVEEKLNVYLQRSFRYYLAIWLKYLYSFVGALLIRIGYYISNEKQKGIRWRLDVVSASMFCCLLLANAVFFQIASTRSIALNLTFLVTSWLALMFSIRHV